ncbi:outer membrane beta-barrel protein [Weeksellaceae bacterium TAE3-ERU29]|nr:outer membrane beta-barrel protein [Weeksellaceae bacterium TAE3-ERU29]
MPQQYSNWKERLKQEEIPPPPGAWEGIANELHPKKKTGVLFFWGRVAALLIPILSGVGIWWWMQETPNYTNQIPQEIKKSDNNKLDINLEEKEAEIKITTKKEIPEVNKELLDLPQNTFHQKFELRKEKSNLKIVHKNINQKNQNSVLNQIEKDISQKELAKNELILTEENSKIINSPDIESNEELKDLVSLISDEKKKKEENIKANQNRISISPYAGWVNFSSAENIINEELSNLESKNMLSVSYGAKASYALSPQWKVTTGVGSMNFHHTTYKVPVTTTLISGINHGDTQDAPLLQIVSLGKTNQTEWKPLEVAETNINNTQKEEVSQEIGFIEIPLEIEYKITQGKKWNFSLATGMSTLLLRKNNLYINQKELNSVITDSQDYNKVSFSANGAVKAEYQLSQHFSVHIEPQIKYFLNSFREKENVTPYIWGISTGVSFGF